MNNKRSLFIGVLASSYCTSASAAGLDTAIMSGGYLFCALLIGFIVYLQKDRKALENRTNDLAKRLAQSEKTVVQMQVIRAELNNNLNMAKAEMVGIEQRRRETADMLASLRTQVERVARVDGLTGVANRQQFDISLHDEIKRCVRERKEISLLLVEIDSFVDFKDINGEQKAEFTLQKIAQSVSESFRRAGDLVARIGEYQFGVLLPGTPAAVAAKFAEKMRRVVYSEALPYPASEIADRITVSVGIASLPPVRLHKAEDAIAMAEAALHQAIQSGCNQVSLGENAAA